MGMVWVATLTTDQELMAVRQSPDSAYDYVNSDSAYQSGRQIDLDKQWHGVHHLLTGSAGATDDPLSIIIGGFEEVGPDNGYGPAWIIPAEAIASCHARLSLLGDDELRTRFDPQAMAIENVYLADLFIEEGDEALGFLMEDIRRLRAFVAKAAAQSLNAIALIT
jgi:hypothetical protein